MESITANNYRNCPKYINIRQLVSHPNTKPALLHMNLNLQPGDRLPQPVIDFILNADTIFLGSLFIADPSIAAKFPSHAGMNSRGGLPGFVRVKPSDGKTVVIPDYSGNRFLMSLGNIESSHLASMTIVDFVTGSILCITGTAQVLVGESATNLMARQACLLTIETTGYTFIENALPFRQAPETEPERSSYSPKVKYLVDEPEALSAAFSSGHKAQLTSAVQLSSDIAVFGFDLKTKEGTAGLKIRPGQAVVLDFMDWIGPPQYKHMANDKPESINDDRVRTWTVSSAHEGDEGVTYFEMTMREMQGGAVTGALFDVLRQHPNNIWGKRLQLDGKVVSDVIGVTGDFALRTGSINALFVAGGIGVTPFISMLAAVSERGQKAEGSVTIALAARDPEPFLSLIEKPLQRMSPKFHVSIDLFTRQKVDVGDLLQRTNVSLSVHDGRIPPGYYAQVVGDKDVFICGPGGFGDAAVESLRAARVPNSKIHREGFY